MAISNRVQNNSSLSFNQQSRNQYYYCNPNFGWWSMGWSWTIPAI